MPDDLECLSKRERQIMDIVYAAGRSTVNDVIAGLQDPPSYNAVRTLMAVLERKGMLKHERDNRRYVFLPAVPMDKAVRSALSRIVRTFFGGSTEEAVLALLAYHGRDIDLTGLERIENWIRDTRRHTA